MGKLKEVQDVPSLIDEEDKDEDDENGNGECQHIVQTFLLVLLKVNMII